MCVVRTIFIIMVAAKLKQELGSSNFGIFFCGMSLHTQIKFKDGGPSLWEEMSSEQRLDWWDQSLYTANTYSGMIAEW